MKIKPFVLFFISIGFCYGMNQQSEAYSAAEKYAEWGCEKKFFNLIENYNLDPNRPIDQIENTLMHKIASCEDIQASKIMIKKTIEDYNGSLLIQNRNGQTPIDLAANKCNQINMVKCLDAESKNDYLLANYGNDAQLYAHHQNQALFQKRNQDYLQQFIKTILNEQTNQNISIRFCKNHISDLAAFGGNYLLVNADKFTRLPSIDAQYALLAHELHHYKNPIDITNITDPTELKKMHWHSELNADYAALQKYPQGTLQLLKWMTEQPDGLKESSDTHPPIATRLQIMQDLLLHYKNRSQRP